MPDSKTRDEYLARVKNIGFDGIELGLETFGGQDAKQSAVQETQKALEAAGVPCVAIRAGGGLSQPNVAKQSRKRLEKSVEVASWIGVGVVNTALGNPPRNRLGDTGPVGAANAHGSSQEATPADYELTAKVLREVGKQAGDTGVNITIEVHQHSIADNSWSTLHLLDMVGLPNVLANPDLGNIFWNYDVPEETSEQAITALAGRSGYWHCKNLHQVYVPELDHSYFVRVPMPDGDIDYRFAISAMVDAKYPGFLAIEGATSGDQLYKDAKSVEYAKAILKGLGA
jgi:sugar phosphate isomerase/epimerase